ncbi:MAG TPA: DUF2851 family protein, partial [Dehalococcoidia bacterium]|nr:DUF2851 family protein [Dehalococcoidia bacterium]
MTPPASAGRVPRRRRSAYRAGSCGRPPQAACRALAQSLQRPVYAPSWPFRLRLGEPPSEPLTEAELSLIWEGQRFPPEALRAVDGRAVEVVHPGRRGGVSGPDFLDAVVKL